MKKLSRRSQLKRAHKRIFALNYVRAFNSIPKANKLHIAGMTELHSAVQRRRAGQYEYARITLKYSAKFREMAGKFLP